MKRRAESKKPWGAVKSDGRSSWAIDKEELDRRRAAAAVVVVIVGAGGERKGGREGKREIGKRGGGG